MSATLVSANRGAILGSETRPSTLVPVTGCASTARRWAKRWPHAKARTEQALARRSYGVRVGEDRIQLEKEVGFVLRAARSDRQAATEAIESIEILDWTRLKPRIYNQLESFY